jgi:predicted HicB family RNase H-like nuclease
MRKSETLNLRVSSEFKRRLVEEAKKEKRSVTNYLEATLAKLWEQKGSLTEGRPRKRRRGL